MAIAKFKGASWRGDFWHVPWVSSGLLANFSTTRSWSSKYPTPASMTRTETFGFSANLPATTLPAVPPIKYSVGVAQKVSR